LASSGRSRPLNLRNAVLLRSVQDLAERDSLTGAANRRMFQASLERVLVAPPAPTARPSGQHRPVHRPRRLQGRQRHAGPCRGRRLLVAVIERISGSVREGDLVARLGGDEFAILTDDSPELKRSTAMAERLVRELRAPYVIDGHHVSVTASIGIASAVEGNESAADLVRNADVAMYLAKANGKAGFAMFDPGMHAAIRERHELGASSRPRSSWASCGLRTSRSSRLRLARWPASRRSSAGPPERGAVPPGDFIEIAEENGAILPIGRWVLREACRAGRRLVADARRAAVPVRQRVGREIQQRGFVESCASPRRAGLDPHRLSLEITETALLKATPPRSRRSSRSGSSASRSSSTTSGPATSRSATSASSRSTRSRSPRVRPDPGTTRRPPALAGRDRRDERLAPDHDGRGGDRGRRAGPRDARPRLHLRPGLLLRPTDAGRGDRPGRHEARNADPPLAAAGAAVTPPSQPVGEASVA
jgi:GGDEF domain-containing protein